MKLFHNLQLPIVLNLIKIFFEDFIEGILNNIPSMLLQK